MCSNRISVDGRGELLLQLLLLQLLRECCIQLCVTDAKIRRVEQVRRIAVRKLLGYGRSVVRRCGCRRLGAVGGR